MNRSLFAVWMTITWIVTLGISYLIGWWRGVRSATTVAVETAQSGFNVMLIALVVVALVSAFGAYKARGYFSRTRTV